MIFALSLSLSFVVAVVFLPLDALDAKEVEITFARNGISRVRRGPPTSWTLASTSLRVLGQRVEDNRFAVGALLGIQQVAATRFHDHG